MKKKWNSLIVAVALIAVVIITLTTWGTHRRITLTQEQMDAISVVVENREQWNDVWGGLSHFGLANRVLMWEKNGEIYFSAGYTQNINEKDERANAKRGLPLSEMMYCLPCCYRIELGDNTLVSLQYGKEDSANWLLQSQVFDPETVTESELTEILAESYRTFLKKNK